MKRPIIAIALSLADKNWRLTRRLAERDRQVAGLTARLRRIQSDVELLGACIPHDKRDMALGLVRDRHRIEDLDEAEAG